MAIAAKISSAELTSQVSSRFVGRSLEARLINAPGTAYLPGDTNDTNFLGFEVPLGIGGYKRQGISFASGDVLAYSDDGVALNTRATVFAQDGSATAIDFSHVALCWSSGNVTDLTVTSPPLAADSVDGTYTNVPVDTTTGTGNSLVLDITVSDSGSTWNAVVSNVGSGYSASDLVTVSEGTLAGIGAIQAGAGDLVISIDGVTSDAEAGQILSVAQTSSAVSLNGGNEAVFYWNIKQFGYYNTTA